MGDRKKIIETEGAAFCLYPIKKSISSGIAIATASVIAETTA